MDTSCCSWASVYVTRSSWPLRVSNRMRGFELVPAEKVRPSTSLSMTNTLLSALVSPVKSTGPSNSVRWLTVFTTMYVLSASLIVTAAELLSSRSTWFAPLVDLNTRCPFTLTSPFTVSL